MRILDYYDLDFARGGLFGRPGVHFGVNASYQANRELSIYSSLSYSQKGYIAFMHLKGEYENYWNGSSTQTVDYEYRRIEKLKLDYVDFPIGAKYKLSNSIEVFGGILFSFLLSDDDNVEISYYYELDGDDDDDDDYDFDDYYEDEDPEDLLTGIQVGISHSVNNRVFSFTINKNSDFGNVGYDDNNDDWSNLTFQISSGITF
tara:strand:+ start:218 stop:826 length:609 start_codon:yes stop_codon:yes gene_type:complete